VWFSKGIDLVFLVCRRRWGTTLQLKVLPNSKLEKKIKKNQLRSKIQNGF
jgi:hypothetical protein